MISILAGISGGTTLAAVGCIIWLVYGILKAKDDQIAARDMLDKTREELATTEGDLKTETAAHAVTKNLLAKEKDLRASAESERNDAFRKARDHYVELIKQSDPAAAAKLVTDLLAAPLPGVSVPDVPAAAKAATDPDGLIDPNL